jgi:hypothetical protein
MTSELGAKMRPMGRCSRCALVRPLKRVVTGKGKRNYCSDCREWHEIRAARLEVADLLAALGEEEAARAR